MEMADKSEKKPEKPAKYEDDKEYMETVDDYLKAGKERLRGMFSSDSKDKKGDKHGPHKTSNPLEGDDTDRHESPRRQDDQQQHHHEREGSPRGHGTDRASPRETRTVTNPFGSEAESAEVDINGNYLSAQYHHTANAIEQSDSPDPREGDTPDMEVQRCVGGPNEADDDGKTLPGEEKSLKDNLKKVSNFMIRDARDDDQSDISRGCIRCAEGHCERHEFTDESDQKEQESRTGEMDN